MVIEEFAEILSEVSDEYIVIDDEDDFLVYRKEANGPVFVGSINSFDADIYDADDIINQLGISPDYEDR
jgi:hypothetical protein|nr:MAG TPA: hypothetical protein [Caudoviricetes sp.]